MLICHYCGFFISQPKFCFGCKADAQHFLKKGIGTQQLVAIIQKLLPSARVERADLDATINKKRWQSTLEQFGRGEIDILVGTQTITKGYHFPRVTLVGVLWADLNLHFPLYNTAETTLQQLIQVAGRAGRQSPGSTVVIQTMMDHPIFQYVNEIDYLKFYEHELEKRVLIGYPPALRFAEVELKHQKEEIVHTEAHHCMDFFVQYSTNHGYQVKVLGPAEPPVAKIKNVFSRRIYLKSVSIVSMIELFNSLDRSGLKSSVFFTPNPLT